MHKTDQIDRDKCGAYVQGPLNIDTEKEEGGGLFLLYTCIYCYFNVGIGGLKGGGSYKSGTRGGGRIKKCSRHISNNSSFNNAAKKSPPPSNI